MSTNKRTKFCRYCRGEISRSSKFCKVCGTKLVQQDYASTQDKTPSLDSLLCPKCKSSVTRQSNYCPNCSFPLQSNLAPSYQRSQTPISSSKILGGIAEVLVLFSFIPYGWIVAIIGVILVLVATKRISEVIGDRSVFSNMLISIVASFVGIVILGVLLMSVIVSAMGGSYEGFGQNPLLGIAVGLVVLWITMIVHAYYFRKSFNAIAANFNADVFKTAGTIKLIGAYLTIVLIGFVIVWLGDLIAAIAFFSMPDQPTPHLVPETSKQPTSSSAYCTQCGARMYLGSKFCRECGTKVT
ncbi:MAG: DUF996 domain-containing protein [Candidatus Bathyarchaeia archaeon]